jgi:hypothetical protein
MGALRILARTDDPNRVVLIERNINEYLKIEIGGKERGLERLRVAIHNEEVEKAPRRGLEHRERVRPLTAS